MTAAVVLLDAAMAGGSRPASMINVTLRKNDLTRDFGWALAALREPNSDARLDSQLRRPPRGVEARVRRQGGQSIAKGGQA